MAIPLALSGIAFSGMAARAEAQQQASAVRVRAARFWRGESRTLLEGIVGFPVAREARAVELTVRDSTGQTLYNEAWTDSAHAQAAVLSSMKAETTMPVEVVLRPGLYSVAVNTSEAGRADSTVIEVRGFSEAPVLSDVVISPGMRMLAEGEKPSAAEMQRGRYAIQRGSRVLLLPRDPKLWYYLELYRQGTDSVAQLEFRVTPQGKEVPLVKVTRQVAVSARGTVDAAALVVQGLPPGDYILAVTAKSGGREERREAAFTMGSFETAPPVLAAPVTAGGTASETALYDRYFAPAMSPDLEIVNLVEAMTVSAPGEHVATENLQLTPDAKRRFLARYWSRVPDPNPATPAHEFFDEYAARARFVEREFHEQQGRSGVKTDRGRIYLKYGAPDAKLHLPIASSIKTVDIWKYTRRKALKYVFLDESGFQNFTLVYTTDQAERTLGDWQARVYDQETLRQIVTF